MEKVKEALKLSLEFIKNGILIRMGEGGTSFQPDLETPLINAIYSALAELDQALLNTCLSNAKQEPVTYTPPPGEHTRAMLVDFGKEPAHDRVVLPQNADQAQLMALVAENWLKHNAPDRLKEPAQAVPVGYMSRDAIEALQEEGHEYIHRDCKLIEDVALYTHPTPFDSDTRKMVLELCRLTILNGAVDGIITAAMEEMAAKICEQLEAGK